MKNLIAKVSETVCRNTIPDFNKRGQPVLTWKAECGYKEISEAITATIEEAQSGDIGNLDNWLDLGLGMYRYKVNDHMAYELRIHYQLLGTDERDSIAELYAVGVIKPNNNRANYFGRLKMVNAQTVESCLGYAKKDLEENE